MYKVNTNIYRKRKKLIIVVESSAPKVSESSAITFQISRIGFKSIETHLSLETSNFEQNEKAVVAW